MAKESIKQSTRSIIAFIQARKLRAAAILLRKLEPARAKIQGYDRLVAAIHSPLTKAEKYHYEAQALVPELIGQGAGDANTRGARIRSAIRRLMKARTIVRDAPEINTLLKTCLATLQAADHKVSAAQGLAVRGDWAAAYKEIKDAAQLDDSPEIKETRKFIAERYRIQTKDEEGIRRAWRIAKIGAGALAITLIAVLMYQCHLRNGVDAVRREVAAQKRRAAATAPIAAVKPAPTGRSPSPPTAPVLRTPQPAPTVGGAAPVPATPPADPGAPIEKTVEIQADAPRGASLGLLPSGTQITLRYKSGLWMPWRAKTGFSPDAPSEARSRHCLGICALQADGATKVLKVVPFRTQETPFTYEIIGRYDSVFLSIQDDDGNFGNNSGVVTYDLRVVRP